MGVGGWCVPDGASGNWQRACARGYGAGGGRYVDGINYGGNGAAYFMNKVCMLR